jgi:triphosphoribosyl-dephospho-CoA synthetase
MERVMFGATGGVNTHKGLIFVLSLLLAGWGIAYARRETSVAAALDMSSEIISPCLLAELEGIKSRAAAGGALTHGERIFARYGLGGIRSEVTRGFPSLRRGLAALEDALSGGAAIRDAALYALLVLMMECEDTNVIHRAGVDFWRGEYKENISATLRKFNPLKPSYYEPMLDLDRFLMRHGASPGGAADLLACTLFIYRSKISGNSFENY